MRHSAMEEMGLELDISRQTKWGGEASQQRKGQWKVTELRGHRGGWLPRAGGRGELLVPAHSPQQHRF